ncbi:MAG: glycosyltransferase family 2 protein [Chloroflexota bacterium]
MNEISFVIVSWNTRDLLQNCLASIVRAANAIAHEIIVVDNASSDDSAAMVTERFPRVNLIRNTQNLGFTKGVNQGLRASDGRFVFLLNSDVELLADTLPALLDVMQSQPRAGIAGCAHQRPDGTAVIAFYDDPTLWRELGRNLFLTDYIWFRLRRRQALRKHRAPTPVDWVMGAAMFARREMIQAIGLLDESVFMYGEEFDWCLRARRRGWRVYYVPTAHILHHENQSGARLYNTRRYSAVTRSLFYFYDKHYGVAQRRWLALLHVIGGLERVVLLSGWWLVIANRAHIRAEIAEHWQALQVGWQYIFAPSVRSSK